VTAGELAAALGARGLRLHDDDGQLVAVSPRSKLTDDDREALRAHKAALLALVRSRTAQVVQVNLWSLDRILEVAVPWSDARLLIAPGCRIARQLRAIDPTPGRVWCVCELADLVLSGVTEDGGRKTGETRITFDAVMTEIRKVQS
jgi:hypothetical protein